MTRFSEIIKNLRTLRQETLDKSRARRASATARSPKPPKKIEFESQELNTIFATMPKDLQDILKKAAKKK